MKILSLSEKGPFELWNRPWHARLKDLAEVAAAGPYRYKPVCAHTISSQAAASPVGSWLGRRRRFRRYPSGLAFDETTCEAVAELSGTHFGRSPRR
ncbi:MAG: hypothetical protein M3N97_03390 [Pseudomonadota bacterium]|nr:hypothetical protein [Pseudomonadota bacterium]